MSAKTFLVTGATGKQGGAVVRSLLAHNGSPQPNILAITRNTSSASAQNLAKLSSSISLIQGDLDDCPAIFKSVSPRRIDGVFSVQMPPITWRGMNTTAEEKQGKDLVDAAIEYGVKHFVYSSVDRGGAEVSAVDDTYVPHFASKARIERYLQERAKSSGMTYTILRTVAFYENMTTDFGGKMFTTGMIGSIPREKKLQLIGTKDIGFFASEALFTPEKYRNEAFAIAGDELDYSQLKSVFEETVGMTLPTTYSFITSFIKWVVADLGMMIRWFGEKGFGADIPELKKRNPGMLSFKVWLKEESQYKNLIKKTT